MEQLDKHGDNFRTASVEIEVKPEIVAKTSRVTSKAQPASKQTDKQNTGGGKKPGPKRKSKADKVTYENNDLMTIYTYFCLVRQF